MSTRKMLTNPTPGELQALHDGLRRLSEQCSEALAALHADEHVSAQHVENVMGINGAVWALRWERWFDCLDNVDNPAPAHTARRTAQ